MRFGFHAASLAAAASLVAISAPAQAQSDAAKQFGERQGVEGISLSPDGLRVAVLVPGPGRTTNIYVSNVTAGSLKKIGASDGNPEAVRDCRWASNTRLACQVTALVDDPVGLLSFSRMVVIDADTGNAKLLSASTTSRSLGVAQGGGEVIDWLPDADGAVLMTRNFVPENTMGTHLADEREGYGVERVDTKTLERRIVEQPRREAAEFLTDGHGTVRIMATAQTKAGYDTGIIRYAYRPVGGGAWQLLSTVDQAANTGFTPVAVDRDLNLAYGFETMDGRSALFSVTLDAAQTHTLIYRRPDVDVDGLIQIGRQQRVVGASFATDKREAVFFDPAVKGIAASLSKALPGLPLVRIVDASADENRLLLWAGSDKDPGRYYVFDRKAKQLLEIMLSRPQLENVALATVKPITFRAADGTEIPGYLTLPPGSDGKNLPAIVMPHGGPSARDEWGFDWLAQFFAARGYAVLQPNFRGSSGYGDSWFADNGFKSWRTAIGDVNDGGRWLTAQGIAAPGKLAIFGWSYGGYAALQSAVLDPDLFKAIVAVAPVTDLATAKGEWRNFTNYRVQSDFIGTGPHIAEGSPARNADKITAPVLIFHGDRDRNVGVGQSRMMEDRLKAAGKRVELIVYPGLDHQLPDSSARIGMLDKTDMFLRAALGIK
jgi:dienelactone hydrolase